MNWNKNNNDNGNPWGSGGNSPWGGGSNNKDFEDSFKKATDKVKNLKVGTPRNFSIFIIYFID